MNINFKTWVAALRSGRYAPGKRMLRSKNDRYCCLGVGCDLMAIDLNLSNMHWSSAVLPPGKEAIPFKIGYDSDDKMPPRDFANWIGKPLWDASVTGLRDARLQLQNAARELTQKAIPIINAWLDDKKEPGLVEVPPEKFDSVFQVLARLNDDGMSHSALADLIEHLDKEGL